MAYEDINNRYDKSYNATKALLESNNKAKLTDLKNQESDINNRYGQLVDTLNKNKVDTQQNYYTQRNSADAVNAQNAQKMNQLAQARGWSGGELAQMNLDQNTQRANSLGALNTQENKFLGDWAMQNTNAKRDNNVALNQLANNRTLANEQYQAGLYSAEQENQAKRLAEIYAMQQAEKQQQWEAEQAALQRAFQQQMQAEQIGSQKELADREYNYKTTQETKSNQNDELKAINAYWDDLTKRFDEMAKMNQKEYRNGDGDLVNKDIDVATKKYIYDYIKNDSSLTSGQRQELMARYNLNKDMYLLEPQQQQSKPAQIGTPVNSLWDEIIGKTKAWWQR